MALELKELSEADLDFSLDVTGFSIAEVDGLIEGLSPEEAGDPAEDAQNAEGLRCAYGIFRDCITVRVSQANSSPSSWPYEAAIICTTSLCQSSQAKKLMDSRWICHETGAP